LVDNVSGLWALALFIATLAVIVLHAFEWSDIKTFQRAATGTLATAEKPSIKIRILQGGLGIETVYYFLLLIAFVVFFPGNLVLLTLIAVLGLVHLIAFQALLSMKKIEWLTKLTSRRVVGFLVFDVLEVLILIVILHEFYPLVQGAA